MSLSNIFIMKNNKKLMVVIKMHNRKHLILKPLIICQFGKKTGFFSTPLCVPHNSQPIQLFQKKKKLQSNLFIRLFPELITKFTYLNFKGKKTNIHQLTIFRLLEKKSLTTQNSTILFELPMTPAYEKRAH